MQKPKFQTDYILLPATFFCLLLVAMLWPSNIVRQPPLGPALALDGDGDYMSVSSSASLSPGSSITVEAWVQPSAFPDDEIAIASKWNDFGIARRYYLLWLNRQRFEVLISHNVDFPRATSTTVAAADTWYHVAGTYDGSTIRLYINGSVEASVDTAGALASNSDPFFVGRADAGANESDYFAGLIDEVRFWSVARTAAEISAAMNDTLGPEIYGNANSGLVGYWRFDALEDLGVGQDGADDVRDLSTFQNHGDLNGDASLDTTIATAIQGHEQGTPTDFALEQNFPNPFNPSTTITYQTTTPGRVILKIYNTSGQEVKTLINEMQLPGNYSTKWDGTNKDGQRISSAVYLYRLNVNGFVKTRKMLAIK